MAIALLVVLVMVERREMRIVARGRCRFLRPQLAKLPNCDIYWKIAEFFMRFQSTNENSCGGKRSRNLNPPEITRAETRIPTTHILFQAPADRSLSVSAAGHCDRKMLQNRH
jgi:hypothetical protein